jgi:hypothetical protein
MRTIEKDGKDIDYEGDEQNARWWPQFSSHRVDMSKLLYASYVI